MGSAGPASDRFHPGWRSMTMARMDPLGSPAGTQSADAHTRRVAERTVADWLEEVGAALAFKRARRPALVVPRRGAYVDGRVYPAGETLGVLWYLVAGAQDIELRVVEQVVGRRSRFWVARLEIQAAWRDQQTGCPHAARLRTRATLDRSGRRVLRVNVREVTPSPRPSPPAVAAALHPGAPRADTTLVATVATGPHPGLEDLRNSCRRAGMDLVVVGKGSAWRGSTHNKLKDLTRFLRHCRGHHTHLLYTDAYDSLVLGPLSSILRRFQEADTPLLMSAERTCFPGGPGRGPEDYPEAPTPYRYLNAGGFIGRIDYLLDVLDQLGVDKVPDFGSDQAWWTDVYLGGRIEMKLDHRCRVFQCLHASRGDLVLDNGIINRVTGTRPLVLHGNGHVWMSSLVEDLLHLRGRARLVHAARYFGVYALQTARFVIASIRR